MGRLNAIQALFLRAKHWQIFVLLFAVPQVVTFAAVLTMHNVLFVVVTAAYGLALLAWYWSLGTFLLSRVNPALRMNPGLFRFALLYPILYVPVFFGLAFTSSKIGVAAIVPLHLLAMWCMVYIFYFLSKHLVIVETGKEASRTDQGVIVNFFLFWFFPLGVWLVQPKVNRLYKEAESSQIVC